MAVHGLSRLCLAIALTAAWVGAALAQSADNWPDKPVRIIVNFAPGGGTDNAIRPFTEPLQRALGQPVVLDHKGGASGAIGLEAAIRSAPNGYTFVASPSPSVAILPQVRKVPYDPFRDLVPVTYFAWYPMMLAAHPSFGPKSVPELVAFTKANPDKVSFASSGVGSTGHLLVEAVNKAAGISILHVPYRGSAEALSDFLAGVVQLFADPTVAPHVKAGKVRLLAVTGNTRHPEYPDVPTLAETYPDANFIAWNALFAPAGTPDAIVRKLNQAMNAIARTPEMANILLGVGQFPNVGSPEDLAARLRDDSDRYGRLIRALNITAE